MKQLNSDVPMPEDHKFHVISGETIKTLLAAAHTEIVDLMKSTYVLHKQGHVVNPDSYFLRFPDNQTARANTLPAAIMGPIQTFRIKWISSFPRNNAANVQRASVAIIRRQRNRLICRGSILQAE
ncbi:MULTISPECIES: hypothetical protein [unclassified Bradyrhizobium]|uniref:hypothetical protein n=1 Tax=unclassified Bradyrhizobium TaxID=2631580 RepID=UPI00291601BF|nr:MULTISPECIES: hypothetical protein [unclassified Bradyrhizobium]